MLYVNNEYIYIYIYIYIHIYIYICIYRWKETTKMLGQKLLRTFHHCAYNNLINILLKKQNLKD